PDDRLARLQSALREACGDRPTFPVTLEGFGAFPPRGMPHILWMGVGQGQEPLRTLAERIDHALEPLDVPKEARELHAHLTVGRVRFIREGKRLRQMIDDIPPLTLGPFTAASVDLMQSVLRPQGPLYTSLTQIPLLHSSLGPNRLPA